MHAIEANANSEVKLCPASEIIGALQSILASSQPITLKPHTPDSPVPTSLSLPSGKTRVFTPSSLYVNGNQTQFCMRSQTWILS
ncbi:hypothetical protein AZE42_06916 [Rhizopogon vesiculosus]|uniref:Uncharacterized protein n=1 Tax=Rhizopogon vesiculosus TaxID=180088 RepID=A0A1J8R4Y4_9AGAM|nr:hypothetical protein AZE42_06916 [Rhizopogon vesiculosus]